MISRSRPRFEKSARRRETNPVPAAAVLDVVERANLPAIVPTAAPLVDALSLPAVGFGRVPITADEAQALAAPIDLDDLAILPTGEVYCGQVFIRRRLNAVFGAGAWGLRPLANPQVQGRTVVQPWLLTIRGQPVAVGYGEAEYYADNPRASWATAIESCKSNALTRAAKDLGIASEVWDRRFTRRFVAERCVVVDVRVYDRRSQAYEVKQQFRLKDDPPFDGEVRAGDRQQIVGRDGHTRRESPKVSTEASDVPSNVGLRRQMGNGTDDAAISDAQLRRAMAIANEHGVAPEQIHAYLAQHCAYTFDEKKQRHTLTKLRRTDYDAAIAFIEGEGTGAREPGAHG